MRPLVSVIFLLFLPGFGVAFARACQDLAGYQSVFIAILGGTFAGVILDQFLIKRIGGVHTFEHELTHAIAALMMLRRVRRFVVTRRDGGWVEHSGGFGGMPANDFIGFAPYILPTFTLFSVLARPLAPTGLFPWFDVWIGITLGFHTWSTIRETRIGWNREHIYVPGTAESSMSDLGSRGLFYSGIVIASTGLAIHGLLLDIVLHGYRGVFFWWEQVWPLTLALSTGIIHWIWNLLSNLTAIENGCSWL